LRNASSEFADQSGYGCRFFSFGPHSKQFAQTVNIHVTSEDVRLVILSYHFSLLVFIADLADDFFDQIFNGYDAYDLIIFLDWHQVRMRGDEFAEHRI